MQELQDCKNIWYFDSDYEFAMHRFDHQHVVIAAAEIFKCSEAQAERFLQGKPTTLKREMDAEMAERYKSHLSKLGIACHLESLDPEPVLELSLADDEEESSSNESSPLELEPVTHNQEQNEQLTNKPSLSLSDNAQRSSSLPIGTASAADANPANTESTGFQCPKCGTVQQQGAECIQCGVIFSKYQASELNHPDSTKTSSAGNNAQDMDEWDEIALFVGTDIDNYRKKFHELQQNDGKYKLQWHWPAFFIPLPWLIYRKLYIWAGILLIFQTVSPFFLLLPLGVTFGLLGNFLYYKHATRQIGKITSFGEERRDDIHSAGGANTMLVTIGGTILAGIVSGFLFFKFFLPAGIEEALNRSAASRMELEQVKDNPTKVQMLVLRDALLLHKQLRIAMKGEFEMPQNMQEFRMVTQIPSKATMDKWGTEMGFEISGENMIFSSAGEDKIMGTDDDIVLETSEKQ